MKQKILHGSSVITSFLLLITCVRPFPAAAFETTASAAHPYSGLVADLFVPAEDGSIEEVFQGRGRETVIIVQDAHSIPAAQKSIQRIIGHFEEQNGLSLMGLEGAASKLDSQFLRSCPFRGELEKALETHFERGELSGAAAAAIFTKSSGSFYGIENWNLYEQGIRLYLGAAAEEKKLSALLESERKSLEAEKDRSYSKELRALDRAVENFYRREANLLFVLQAAAAVVAPAKGSDIEIMLNRAQENGTGIDAEVRGIAKSIEGKLNSEKETAEIKADRLALSEKTQRFNTSALGADAFALYLESLGAKYGVRIEVSAVLRGRMREQKTIDDIEGTEFFETLEAYIVSAKKKLMNGAADEALERKNQDLRLLEKAARLELTRRDWNALRGRTGELHKQFPGVDYSRQARFYENAEARDGVLFEKLTALMKERKESLALIAAGGFHAQGLSRRLKEKGISYVLVVPKISRLPETNDYRNHMRGDVSWKNYFRAENGRVNFYKAFMRHMRDQVAAGRRESRGQALKEWRDQILRDLARQKRTGEAGRYTGLIDEVLRDADDRTARLDKVEEFVRGVRRLESAGRVTAQNILQLVRPAGIEAMASGVLILSPDDSASQTVLAGAGIPNAEDTAGSAAAVTPADGYPPYAGENAAGLFADAGRSELRHGTMKIGNYSLQLIENGRTLEVQAYQLNEEGIRIFRVGEKQVFTAGSDIRVGSGPDVEIPLESPDLMPVHAVIRYDSVKRRWLVRDNGSRIGTIVNGANIRASAEVLQPGAWILIDEAEFFKSTLVRDASEEDLRATLTNGLTLLDDRNNARLDEYATEDVLAVMRIFPGIEKRLPSGAETVKLIRDALYQKVKEKWTEAGTGDLILRLSDGKIRLLWGNDAAGNFVTTENESIPRSTAAEIGSGSNAGYGILYAVERPIENRTAETFKGELGEERKLENLVHMLRQHPLGIGRIYSFFENASDKAWRDSNPVVVSTVVRLFKLHGVSIGSNTAEKVRRALRLTPEYQKARFNLLARILQGSAQGYPRIVNFETQEIEGLLDIPAAELEMVLDAAGDFTDVIRKAPPFWTEKDTETAQDVDLVVRALDKVRRTLEIRRKLQPDIEALKRTWRSVMNGHGAGIDPALLPGYDPENAGHREAFEEIAGMTRMAGQYPERGVSPAAPASAPVPEPVPQQAAPEAAAPEPAVEPAFPRDTPADRYGFFRVGDFEIHAIMDGPNLRLWVYGYKLKEGVEQVEGQEIYEAFFHSYREFMATPGMIITLGRLKKNTVQLATDYVSREHAQLRYDPKTETWEIQDRGSTAGLILNGNEINTQEAAEGQAKEPSKWFPVSELDGLRAALGRVSQDALRISWINQVRHPEMKIFPPEVKAILEQEQFSRLLDRLPDGLTLAELIRQIILKNARDRSFTSSPYDLETGDLLIEANTGNLYDVLEQREAQVDLGYGPREHQLQDMFEYPPEAGRQQRRSFADSLPGKSLLELKKNSRILRLADRPANPEAESLLRDADPDRRMRGAILTLAEHPFGILTIEAALEHYEELRSKNFNAENGADKKLYDPAYAVYRVLQAFFLGDGFAPYVLEGLRGSDRHAAALEKGRREKAQREKWAKDVLKAQIRQSMDSLAANEDVRSVIDFETMELHNYGSVSTEVLLRAREAFYRFSELVLPADQYEDLWSPGEEELAANVKFIAMLWRIMELEIDDREINSAFGQYAIPLRSAVLAVVREYGTELVLHTIKTIRNPGEQVTLAAQSLAQAMERQEKIGRIIQALQGAAPGADLGNKALLDAMEKLAASYARSEVRPDTGTVFYAILEPARSDAGPVLAHAAEAMASEPDYRKTLLSGLEELRQEALQDLDFLGYLERERGAEFRDAYIARADAEMRTLENLLSALPEEDRVVGFDASRASWQGGENDAFIRDFISAAKQSGVKYVVITGERASEASPLFRANGFKVVLPDASAKEILLPSMDKYTGVVTRTAGERDLSFSNAVSVGLAPHQGELDPFTARYVTLLQTVVSLLIESEATDAARLKQLLGNPAALLAKLPDGLGAGALAATANGLQISTAAIQLYLEWRAEQSMQVSA